MGGVAGQASGYSIHIVRDMRVPGDVHLTLPDKRVVREVQTVFEAGTQATETPLSMVAVAAEG